MLAGKQKLKEVHQHIVEKLSDIYQVEEAKSICYILMESEIGDFRLKLITSPENELNASALQNLQFRLDRCLNHEPVHYVLGYANFYGLQFYVDRNVLIPRPETEELVDWILKQELADKRVLDIGTGSGCIAVSISKNTGPTSEVQACDISDKALEIANRNAEKHAAEIKFFKADALELLKYTNDHYDIIVSNPPYVPETERESIERHVLDFEPELALFVPKNHPLLFYEAIINFASNNLSPNGELFFEIHKDFGRGIEALLKSRGFGDVEIRKDLSGRDRMIRAKRTP